MSRIISAAVLGAAFAARNPSTETGGRLASVEAQAMKGLSSMTTTRWVKATEHFFVKGEIVCSGDLVEVTEDDAKRLIRDDQAVAVTDEDLASAQKSSKGK